MDESRSKSDEMEPNQANENDISKPGSSRENDDSPADEGQKSSGNESDLFKGFEFSAFTLTTPTTTNQESPHKLKL